jgi:murein DD-endopeptidase MepM/ murein hydrolase activator NlpD
MLSLLHPLVYEEMAKTGDKPFAEIQQKLINELDALKKAAQTQNLDPAATEESLADLKREISGLTGSCPPPSPWQSWQQRIKRKIISPTTSLIIFSTTLYHSPPTSPSLSTPPIVRVIPSPTNNPIESQNNPDPETLQTRSTGRVKIFPATLPPGIIKIPPDLQPTNRVKIFPATDQGQRHSPQLAKDKRPWPKIVRAVTPKLLASKDHPKTTKPPANFINYTIQTGDSLSKIAERFGISTQQLLLANPQFKNNGRNPDLIFPGEKLQVPIAQNLPTTTPHRTLPTQSTPNIKAQSIEAKPIPEYAHQIDKNGYLEIGPGSTYYTTAWDHQGAQLAKRYQGRLFSSLKSMPPKLRDWYVGTVVKIAREMNFPPEIVLAIHFAEQVGGGFRPFENRSSYVGTVGPGQWTRPSWNGWHHPVKEKYDTNQWRILKHGGLGVDYRFLDLILKARKGDTNALEKLKNVQTLADPRIFENNVVATILHLERDGVVGENFLDPKLGLRQKSLQRLTLERAARDYCGGDSRYAKRVVQKTLELIEQLRISFPELLQREIDKAFGKQLSKQELQQLLNTQPAVDYTAGKITTQEAARQIVDNLKSRYLAQGRKDQGKAWPHFKNKEWMETQFLAVKYLGHFLDYQELSSLMDKYQANLEDIENDLSKRADAQLFAQLQFLLPRLWGRYVYNYQIRKILSPFLEENFINKDLHQVDQRQLLKVYREITDYLLSTPETQAQLPLLVRIKQNSPLGAVLADEKGNPIPFLVRRTIKDRAEGEVGPFELHGNKDYFKRTRKTPWEEWYGIDIIPQKRAAIGTPVISPIEGKVVKVVVDSDDDGPSNSVWVEGTGPYQGLFIRILHLGPIKVSAGDRIIKGDYLGQIGSPVHIHFELKTQNPHSRKHVPLPSVLLFAPDTPLAGLYQANDYLEGDVVNIKGLAWLDWSTFWAIYTPADFPGYRQEVINEVHKYYQNILAQLPPLSRQAWSAPLP